MSTFQKGAALFNRVMTPLLSAPVIGGKLGESMAEIGYVGRRSGREVSLVVAYRRSGDELTIGVAMPEKKSWWRNFLGDGAPITVRLDGVDRPGHAVANRTDAGVSVKVALEPAPTS